MSQDLLRLRKEYNKAIQHLAYADASLPRPDVHAASNKADKAWDKLEDFIRADEKKGALARIKSLYGYSEDLQHGVLTPATEAGAGLYLNRNDVMDAVKEMDT